jgi:hypothetical protein
MIFFIQSALHGTGGLVIVVDVLYPGLVKAGVGLAQGEEVGRKVGLVFLSDG